MAKAKETRLRAVGYCRTSGEGQRDNTSIPRQKEAVEAFCKVNGWQLLRFYVDECRSGANIVGRDAFQEMMKHATDGQFDVVVPYDATRFARDGVDILSSAKFLKSTFEILLVDAKAQFDNRTYRNVLANFVHAGVSEHERLSIMERMIGARIQRARDGLCWTPQPPFGRTWTPTSKRSGVWGISEQGIKMQKLCERYVAGESMSALAKEYGFTSVQHVNLRIHRACLAHEYIARFNCPELGIKNLAVPVPAVPQVISPELEQRVLARLEFRRTWNRVDKKTYYLSGFLFCGDCSHSLLAQSHKGTERRYYQHAAGYRPQYQCSFNTVRTDGIEAAVLDYLYRFFLDKRAYQAAVEAALPSADGRKKLETELAAAEKALAKTQREIKNLAMAVAEGGKVSLLLDTQDELEIRKEAEAARVDGLRGQLAGMPDAQQTKHAAMVTRLLLLEKFRNRDWRNLPYDEIRRFLHALFGDNPRKEDNGIFVTKDSKGRLTATFKGRVAFNHLVSTGRPLSKAYCDAVDRWNAYAEERFGDKHGASTDLYMPTSTA